MSEQDQLDHTVNVFMESVAALAEVLGMQAQNDAARFYNSLPQYNSADFGAVAARLRERTHG